MALSFAAYEARLLAKRPDIVLTHFEGMQKPVTFICPRHGEVTASTGQSALRSAMGCPHCGNEAGAAKRPFVPPPIPVTLTEAEIRAALPAPYVFQHIKSVNPRRVYFLCPTHGLQSVLVYKASHGCPKCGKARRGKQKETAP